MSRFYSAYNYFIESELEFDNLTPVSDASPDISISIAKTPVIFQDCVHQGRIQIGAFKINSLNEILLDIKGLAIFCISKGRDIIVEPYPEYNKKYLQSFLLGSIMSILFHQKGLFTLHGSAVTRDNEAIIFTGKSKAGKSTFAHIFQEKGYKLLTDDVCLIERIDSDDFIVRPAIPLLSLRADVVENLNLRSEKLHEIGYRNEKFGYRVNHNFENVPSVIRTIIEIVECDDELEIINYMGIEKVSSLIRNTYRIKAVNEMGLYAEHFKVFSELAQKVNVFKVRRPTGVFVGKEIISLVENEIDSLA